MLSKNVDHQSWKTTKSALKLSPKNGNLDQNINDSKILYLEFFFLKYYFEHTKFSYLSRSSSGFQSFFNLIFSSRKSQSQHKLAKQITRFKIQFSSKNFTQFTNINSLDIENNMLPQHNQKPFWLYKFSANMFTAPFLDAQELHSWSTLKANVLYISLRTFLFQRRSKVLSGKGSDGGGWIISLRQLTVWALQNILQFFVLIYIFENSTIFSILILPSIALKRWHFPDNLDFKGTIVTNFLIRSHFLSI